MCLQNQFYPLVYLKNGKRKILFNCGVKVTDRESFEAVFNTSHTVKQNGVTSQYLYKYLKNVEYERFDKMVQVPCGCCRECLADNSKQWAFRILKEAAQYENNYFITFTYNDEFLPKDRNLDKLFFQKINKKLKKYLKEKQFKSDFRFYGVGEYGSKTARPHYHCIYFNLDLQDLKFEYIDNNHNLHFSSAFLNNVYCKLVEDSTGKKVSKSIGFIDIGSVDIGSACYVARYCDKKRRLTTSEKKELLDKGIVPEFAAMSRKPGIGASYYDEAYDRFIDGKFYDIEKGKQFKLPLYYTKKLKEILKDTPELERYEIQAKRSASITIANQLQISDLIDLNSYNNSNDVIHSKRGL